MTTARLPRWPPRRPYNVLRLELRGELGELETEFSLRDLGRRRGPDLLTLLAALRSAREDPELGLVVVEVDGLGCGWGRIQTVRRALLGLRAAGKRVWCVLSQPGMRDYYLGCAADRVWLPPPALFDASGLVTEVVFLKGALDKLGVEVQLARSGRFKSAAEPFTRTGMSPEHRSMVDALLDDLYAQLLDDVARARGLEVSAVRDAFAAGPLLAAEACRRGLVDALAYPDQVEEEIERRFGDPATIEIGAYQRRRALANRRAARGAPVVGLLSVSGPISGRDAIPGVVRAASWRVFRRELDAMARDTSLAAIVLRIDSPGGSGFASDLMWRSITLARRRKPVLVSMGDVAASGGYYLAAGSDHVTAEAATLTGSIGVLAGKPVLRGLYDLLGVTKELVVRGNAARHSDYVPLDAAELAQLQAEADAFYGDFVARVASGRGLARETVEAAAEGRVWTGRQALSHGLVDALGGLEQTLDEVKRRLDLPRDARVAVERRPRSRTLWQLTLGRALPGGPGADLLDWLAPAFVAERVLAVGPILLRFATAADDVRRALAGTPLASLAGGAERLGRPARRGVRGRLGALRAVLRPARLVF